MQIKTNIASCHTADSKPVKQEVNGTVILPPLVFPEKIFLTSHLHNSYIEIPYLSGYNIEQYCKELQMSHTIEPQLKTYCTTKAKLKRLRLAH